ncbi:phospholipase [Sediminibacterium roseum]|uniref:Phospholipase n=1 Tax=Sediminibacterium roseum TaxID=1978412 RepID=A0ABW9ZXQ8_9BACT|nr:phospholipase D-like domain-containing protein [Sediminibacterium roseum]NCI49641.1 phospholipase [Sediminibacterium roseum]
MKRKISKQYSHNNKAQLIRGGKEYFEKILSLIAQASSSIHLQTYIFEDDETGRLVADALKTAARRGVKVYLMVDGYASQALSKTFIGDLESAGVQFRFFQPLLKSEHFYFGRRMHHKILVVDAQCAVTGSKNISNRYNDMPGVQAWLDLNVYIEGDAAKELCLVCVKTWNGFRMEPGSITCNENKTFHYDPSESVEIRVRRNDWVRRKSEISSTYTEMLRKAESHITILCSYFLPGKIIRDRLRAAARRGVVIKVIVAGRSDVKLSKNAERWLYDWLLRNKIQVYEYEPAVLHAKSTVCDGKWVTIGSYNINNISAYTSIELNVDIRNKSFAAQVEATLEDIIQNESTLITTETLQKTKNIFKQFIRWASYQAIRTLFYVATFYYKRR